MRRITHQEIIDKIGRRGERLVFNTFLKNKKNAPQILYHGTLKNFEKFYPLSHFGTKAAAEQALKNAAYCFGDRLIEEQPDLIDDTYYKEYEEICVRKMQEEGKVIPVLLNISRPLEIIDIQEHCVFNYKKVILNLLEREKYTDLMFKTASVLRRFAVAGVLFNYEMQQIPRVYDMIFKDPLKMNAEAVYKELSSDTLFKIQKNSYQNDASIVSNRVFLSFQRMIRFLERRGFDSFKYINRFEDKGHYSYIVFRPEQVIRLDRDLPEKVVSFHSPALSIHEKEALERCIDRPLSQVENKNRLYFQETLLENIPLKQIKRNRLLKDVIKMHFPNWENLHRI